MKTILRLEAIESGYNVFFEEHGTIQVSQCYDTTDPQHFSWSEVLADMGKLDKPLPEPKIDIESASATAREERNRLLVESDWTMMPDAPTDKTAWAKYRQELRDITDQPGYPIDIQWPMVPTEV